jgi:GNAT superfamily N-acetyltransferase
MKNESDLGRSCKSHIFFTEFQKVIDLLLNSCAILIACSPEEEDAIIGYLIFQPDAEVIHYAWVRPACRRLGIAKELVYEAFGRNLKSVGFSLNTNDAKKINKLYPDKLIHNPFILFKKGE